jgi:integrase
VDLLRRFDGELISNWGQMRMLSKPQVKRLKLDTEGARIDPLRIHDLRRTLGSWQAEQGASLAIIGTSLNHKSQQATAMMEAAGVRKTAEVVKLSKTS